MIIIMEEIADQSRLYARMRVAPGIGERAGLLLSLEFMRLLLEEAPQLTMQAQKALVLQLLSEFSAQPLNSLLLYLADQQQQQQAPLLNLLVQAMLRLVRSHEDAQPFYPMLPSLLSHYPAGLAHVTTLTQALSTQFQLGDFNAPKARFIHNLLQHYYGPKNGMESYPSNYFFFYGMAEGAGIRSLQNMSVPLRQEIAIALSFCMLERPKEEMVLARITTTRESLRFRVGKYISVEDQNIGLCLAEPESLLPGKWYKMVANLTTQSTCIMINGEEVVSDRAVLTPHKDRHMVEYSFGEFFLGSMTGILIFNKSVARQKAVIFPELLGWRDFRFLMEHKLHESSAASILPISQFELGGQHHTFDIIRKHHSVLGQAVHTHHNQTLGLGISRLGDYETMLPLFYLARFYSVQQYPDQLQQLLKIWLTSLEQFKDSQNREQFLLIVGHHLEALPQLLTAKCVTLLGKIWQRLSENNKVLFLRHVGWSGLPARASGPAVEAWLLWITRLYQNNKTLCLRAYGLMDVVFWLVKHLQNNQQHCCSRHYLSEARALRQFSFDDFGQLDSHSKQQHFEAVQNIAAVILEYSIIDHPEVALKQVRSVLRLLLHKYSACLYTTILTILKNQIPKFASDQTVSKLLLSANILPFLAALAEKVVDPSLLAMVGFLMLLCGQMDQGGWHQIAEFLSSVLRRLQDIHSHRFNLLAHGSRKVRKPSASSKPQADSVSLLFQRISAFPQDFSPLMLLFINSVFGVISYNELTHNFKMFRQEGLYLLKSFLPIANQTLLQQILAILTSRIKDNPGNIRFALECPQFHKLIVAYLEDPQLSEQEQKLITQIVECILGKIVKDQKHVGDLYFPLKSLAPSNSRLSQIFTVALLSLLSGNEEVPISFLYEVLMTESWEKDWKSLKSGLKLHELLLNMIGTQLRIKFLTFSVVSQETHGDELIDKTRSIEAEQLESAQLSLQVRAINEEEITFLFDMFLPKMIVGVDVSPLLTHLQRPVYVFELYFWSLVEAMQKGQQNKGKCEQYLTQAVVIAVIWAIIRKQPESDASLAKMLLFTSSHHFVTHQKQRLLRIVWNIVLSFVRGHLHNAKDYADVKQKISEAGYETYLIELLDVFLVKENAKHFLPFDLLVQQSYGSTLESFIKELNPLLTSSNLQNISSACRQSAFEAVNQPFSSKMIQHQQQGSQDHKLYDANQLYQAVERIFEEQSVGEEQTRLRYLHEHEGFLRKYHSRWNKAWKKLRLYHKPYGIYMAQNDSALYFQLPNSPLKNYKFKVSKHSANSGTSPVLEAQIIQPWHVRKVRKQQNRNQISSLVELMKPTQFPKRPKVVKQGGLTKLWKGLTGQAEKVREQAHEWSVLWLKRGHKARGKLMFSQHDELVFWYESLKQSDSHLAFAQFSLPFNKVMVKKWRVECMVKISSKRYLMRYHALEMSLQSGKSLLFHFEDQKEQQFIQVLQRIRSERLSQSGNKLKLNKVPMALEDWITEGLNPKITQDWCQRHISTLQYLLAINKAASRSIYDMSQYPVFPWVCAMANQKQPTIRDLTKTLGGLGSAERRKIVMEKYNSNDPFNPVPPFQFGTHYSSPGVVFNFLIRLSPFTDYCKNLQGGRFDIPDRLFSSFVSAWTSAENEVSDVRELLPEFYYIPQCLLNTERLRLGVTQNHETVDHVKLPPWAAGNPYFLTTQMRQMLESELSGQNIHEWINLIFGCKQRGEQARDAYNVYYYLTYEEYSNCLQDQSDEVYRKSCEAQVVHFGQIPPQVMDKPHPSRLSSDSQPLQLTVKETVHLMNFLKQRLIGIYRSGSEMTLIKRDCIEVLSLAKSPAVMTKSINFNFTRTLSRQFYGIKKEKANIIFFRQFFLIYGYITNQFRIFHRLYGNIQLHHSFESPITHMFINKQQSLLFVCTASGLLSVYELEYEGSKLTAKKAYTQMFPSPLAHVSQNDGFFAVSFGCYVSIYKFERSLHYMSKGSAQLYVRFFRSFKNNLKVRGAFIADCPLYSLLLWDNAHVKVYSINGQLIKTIACSPNNITPLKDRQLNSIFCVHEDNRMILLSSPDLRCLCELQLGQPLQVFEGTVVYERQIMFVGL